MLLVGVGGKHSGFFYPALGGFNPNSVWNVLCPPDPKNAGSWGSRRGEFICSEACDIYLSITKEKTFHELNSKNIFVYREQRAEKITQIKRGKETAL